MIQTYGFALGFIVFWGHSYWVLPVDTAVAGRAVLSWDAEHGASVVEFCRKNVLLSTLIILL